MKKKFTAKIDAEHVRRALYSVRYRAQNILLYRYRAVAFVLLLLILIAGGAAGTKARMAAGVEDESIVTRQGLSTAAIDALELWIEERQTAYENPPSIPESAFNQ